MRFYRSLLLLISCIALGLLLPSIIPTLASVVGTGHPVHDNIPQGTQTYTADEFFVHPPSLGTLARRDLELQVDARYSYDRGLSHDQNVALDALAHWIADEPLTDAFRLPMRHLQLVYEYLRQPSRSPYSTDPSNPTSFTTGPDSIWDGVHLAPIPLLDRSNVDYYIYRAGHPDYAGARHGGEYPSSFEWQKEDSTTGHWSQTGNNPPVYQVFHGNSVMFNGPADNVSFTYPGPAGWNASNRLADTEFAHEFQHSLVHPYADGAWGQMDEVFSCVAEALLGMTDPDAGNEVPYAWPIMQTANYQNWRLLTPYLLFNFLGIDTTRTATGITDDLVYRWSRSPRRYWDLAELLSDQASPELIGKGYFRPGGASLDNSSRLSLLLHNWRVANYVNNASLEEGQYGFAGAFSPWSQRPWQSFNGVTVDDAVAVPPEVTARRAWATGDTTIFGYRYQPTQGGSIRYPTFLEGYGSEYWVVRSDASLGQGQQDLVVRVTPEGVFHRWSSTITGNIWFDGRLVASVVSYSQQDTLGVAQPLWRHPNWATTAIQPTWVDVDSAAGALEFVVPNFGTSNKAAVVVLSLGDGPLRGLSRLGHLNAADTSLSGHNQSVATLPYRINFAIRSAPYQTQNPLPVAQTPNAAEDFATWSPAGDEIAYVKDDGSGYTRIYRRKLDGSAPAPLLPSVTNFQSHPDWSPRGDLVAFDQVFTPIHSDIWIANAAAQTASQLPNAVGNASWPVFQPNGQGLAYLHYFQRSWQSPDSASVQGYRSEIRTVGLDGTADVALVISGSQHFTSPRWAADGGSVYFISQDTLYNVRLSDQVVTMCPGPNGDVTSFDLALGSGPKAIERPGILFYDPTAFELDPDSSVAFRRVALRDGTGDTQARFYRTSAEFANPRWSFDGTRIAYSSNQNDPGDRDLFVGQVSYDHPPVLDAAVQDLQVEQGSLVQRTIQATDPDGEALTFAAAYLPAGATLSEAGAFHWQVPANSAGTSYYVVFRTLDPSWGVANKVVRFDVIQGGGGCPFADTWTVGGWRVENSILGRSLNGSLALDAYRLKSTPAVEGGRYRLRLRESEQESTVLDQVRLAYVDHAPDLRAWALGERVVLGTRVPPYRVTTNQGDDITSLVNGSGTGFFAGQPGDTVLIDLVRPGSLVAPESASPGGGGLDPFDDGDGGKDGAAPGGGYRASGPGEDRASPDALVLNSTGILIQGRDEAGVWSTIRHRYPRENNDEFLVDTLDQGPVRMVFLGRHRLNHVGRVVPTGVASPQALRLVSAQHSRLGDVRAALLGAQDETTALTPGDTLGLEFAATAVPAGQVRDFFLLSRGVYTSVATAFASRPAPGSTTPLDYALLQNRPNPFTGGTVIGFELPRAEGVKLEVFDLAGRRVRVLAEGSYAPGRWSIEWNRRDAAGSLVRPGVYLYRLRAGAFHAERKMVLMP